MSLRRAAAAVVLTCVGMAAPVPVSAQSPAAGTEDPANLTGEGGLHVRLDGDTMRVYWITARPEPGRLEVLVRGERRHETTTAAATAHVASLRVRGRDPVTLRYGSAADAADRYETVVDPRTGSRRPHVRFSGADSIFVIGDIHGEYDTLVHVLRNAGVVDDALHWAAGESHLVVVGDVMDRGEQVTRVLWLLYRLEREAAAASGHVHLVLGNHELMVMLGDLRYVAPAELEVAQLHGFTYDRLFDPRRSILGRWLASRPGLIRIDDVLFAHGGVSPALLGESVESVEDTLARFTGEELFDRWTDTTYVPPLDSAALARRNDFFWDESSLFWFRGYAQQDTLGNVLDAVLERYRATVHVVGHTPDTHIRERYGGRLIATNTLPFAAELLLLVRTADGWARYRVATTGQPVPLVDGAAGPAPDVEPLPPPMP